MRRWMIWLAAVATGAVCCAAELPPLVRQALANMERPDAGQWAYTMRTTGKEGSRVERYDPSRPAVDRWRLLEEDGRPPTEKSLRRYREEKRKEAEDGKKKEKGDGGEVRVEAGLDELLDPATLKVVEETPAALIYEFQPRSADPDNQKLFGSLRGKLTVTKDHPYIRYLEMYSTARFTPAFSVKIDRFYMKMVFQRLGEDGPIVPETNTSIIKGRALLFKSIDENVTVSFTDFACVG